MLALAPSNGLTLALGALAACSVAVATTETEVGLIRDALLFCDELEGLVHQLVQILHLFAVDTCGALDDECSCRRHTTVV